MASLPEEMSTELPLLYATEHEPDPMVWSKFFTPWGDWSWYPIEFDGADICFGLVVGFEIEFGYFSLAELMSVRGPCGVRIEQDLGFEPCRLSVIRDQ